jgi:hypothetical protein
MELGRQSMNECIPGRAMISYGLRYFSESFLDGLVVRKNWALTKTLLPTANSGAESQHESADL